MIMVWVFCGIINQWLATGVVIACVLLLKKKNRYLELIWGFFFILIMGDNREWAAAYGANSKTIYLVLLALFYFLDKKNFQFKNDFFYPYLLFFGVGFIAIGLGPAANMSNAAQKWLAYILLYSVIPMYFLKLLKENGEQFLKELMKIYGLHVLTIMIIKNILKHLMLMIIIQTRKQKKKLITGKL